MAYLSEECVMTLHSFKKLKTIFGCSIIMEGLLNPFKSHSQSFNLYALLEMQAQATNIIKMFNSKKKSLRKNNNFENLFIN